MLALGDMPYLLSQSPMDSAVDLLIHHLGRAHHLVQGLIQKEIKRRGIDGDIHPGMRPIFCILANEAGMPISDLAARLGQAKSSVTGAVRRMESAGLVVLYTDGADGRRRWVKLTPKGRNLVPVCRKVELMVESQLAARLTPEEIQTLLRLLIKLNDIPLQAGAK